MVREHRRKPFWIIRELFHRVFIVVGAAGATLVCFLVLPLMQTISKPPSSDLVVQAVDTAKLEAPDPPVEPEPQEEPEPEDSPPELTENAAPLDLSQLELALNPGFSEGWLGGDFAVSLKTVVSRKKDVDALFSLADLDQRPRVIYQPSPVISRQMREKTPGTVYVLFMVDQQGRVMSPRVQKSTDPIFETAALSAVKKWKFEPGKRNGQAVRFRMRVPITFPKGS